MGGLRALGITRDHPWIRQLASRPWRDGRLDARPQAGDNATYAAKIDRDEAIIDWNASAQKIDRAVRAFNPVPGAGTRFEGMVLKIWDAVPDGTPIEILP